MDKSIALFTSTRVYTMSAGNFAVVNTKDSLNATLSPGIGTIVDDETNAVTVGIDDDDLEDTFANDGAREAAIDGLAAGDAGKIYKQGSKYYVCTGAKALSDELDRPYSLTDSSFDHNIAAQNLVVPDSEGTKIGKLVSMTSATIESEGIKREYAKKGGIILSAMTWDITFTVLFSDSATKDIGLFFDAANSAVTLDGSAAPDKTGKAFKIAMMPKTIPAESLGLTKVWADSRPTSGDPHSQFINSAEATPLTTTLESATVNYASATSSLVNTTRNINVVSPSLIDSNNTVAVPSDNTLDKAGSLAMATYLGFFKRDPGREVKLTFTCVAFFEGSDPMIVTSSDTVYQTVQASMTFGVSNLTD